MLMVSYSTKTHDSLAGYNWLFQDKCKNNSSKRAMMEDSVDTLQKNAPGNSPAVFLVADYAK